MKVEVTDLGSWKRKLDIAVPVDDVRPHLENAYQSYQKKVRIEGFRKGKVPLSIIQKRFGKAIEAEVVDQLIQTFFKKAVEEENLDLVAPGTVKDITFEEGKPFQFTAEVEIEPVVEITEYKGLKLEKEIMKVTKEDVAQVISMFREQKAERRPVTEGAQKGHVIEGDVQAVEASGVPIIGQKWEDRVIELGQPPLGDKVEDQFLGAVKDEERRFSIKQPEQDPNGNMQEKEHYYVMKIKSVQEKILPVLNDDFAKEVGEFVSFSEMEDKLKEDLQARREQDAEQVLDRKLIDEIIHKNDFDLPEVMVSNALKMMWEDHQKQHNDEVDEETFRNENRVQTVWNLKWHLLWHRLAEAENIIITDEDIDARIDLIAKANPKEEKKVKTMLKDKKRRDHLKENLLEQKVLQFLKENARIKEVKLKPSKKKQPVLMTS